MNARTSLAVGAIAALLAVAAGAFGAHALAQVLDERRLRVFETAARYQMFHALALVAVGVLGERDGDEGRALRVAATAFTLGIALFCGSLYPLALGAPRGLGAITPLGGVAFMVGWGALAWSTRSRRSA